MDSPTALPLLFPTGKVLQAQRSLTFGKWQGDRSRRHRPLLQQDDRGRQEDGRRQRRLLLHRGGRDVTHAE